MDEGHNPQVLYTAAILRYKPLATRQWFDCSSMDLSFSGATCRIVDRTKDGLDIVRLAQPLLYNLGQPATSTGKTYGSGRAGLYSPKLNLMPLLHNSVIRPPGSELSGVRGSLIMDFLGNVLPASIHSRGQSSTHGV